MANFNISGNTTGILTSQVILVLREKSDLLTIVFQQAFTANTQFNVTVPNLNPVMHQVELWDTPDGTTLGTLRCTYDADVAQSSGSGSFSYIQFKVGTGVVTGTGITTAGVCPVDSNTQYVDTALDGLSYIVSKAGFGILQWGQEIQMIAGGGFEFIDGQVFSDMDEYTVIVANSSVSASTPSAASDITDIVLHTSDDPIVGSDAGKLHVFNFSGNVAVLTFAALATFSGTKIFYFNTHRGSQINGEIAFQSGEGCYFRGSLRNKIYLGRNEAIKIIIKSGVAYAVQYEGWYDRVGERVMSDVLTATPNTLPMTNAALYSGTIYKRVYEWLTTVLAAGQKTTQALYDTTASENSVTVYPNRGKWMVDTVAGTFRTPDVRGQYPRAINAGEESGRHMGWQVGAHFHEVGTEPDVNARFDKGTAHNARAWSAGNAPVNQTASTDYNTHSDGTIASAGANNEVNNIGYFPIVII